MNTTAIIFVIYTKVSNVNKSQKPENIFWSILTHIYSHKLYTAPYSFKPIFPVWDLQKNQNFILYIYLWEIFVVSFLWKLKYHFILYKCCKHYILEIVRVIVIHLRFAWVWACEVWVNSVEDCSICEEVASTPVKVEDSGKSQVKLEEWT